MRYFIQLIRLVSLLLMLFALNSQAQILNQEGATLLVEKQYHFAKDCFERQLKMHPEDVPALTGLGNCYLGLDNSDSAKVIFRKLLDLDTKNYTAMIGLGLVAWINHDRAAEFDYFERARRSDKSNPEVYCAIAAGCLEIEKKDTVSALTYLRQGLDLFPKFARLHLLMGDLESSKKNFGSAVNAYERAIFFDPKSHLPYRKQGVIHLVAHAYREAFTALNKSIALDPDQVLGYKYLGDLYYTIGKYDVAEHNYQTYLERAEITKEDEERFALTLFFNKKFNEAQKRLEQLDEINNNPAIIHRIRGYIAYETGEYQKARELMSQFFSVQDPKKIIALDYSYYANILLKLGDEQQAMVNFKKAVALDPEKAELYEALAKLTSKTGLHAESAIYYLEIANHGGDKIVNNFLAAKEYYLEGEIWRSKQDSVTSSSKSGKLPAAELFAIKKMMALNYALSDSTFTVVTKINAQYAGSYIWKGRIKSILDPEALTTGAKEEYEKALTILEKTDRAKNAKSIIECYKYLGSYYYLGYERNYKTDKKLAGEMRVKSIECFKKIKELDPGDNQAKEVLKKINDPK